LSETKRAKSGLLVKKSKTLLLIKFWPVSGCTI